MARKGILLPRAAKDLLKRGFYIFPTRPGKKAFYKIKWSKEASNDPNQVAKWAKEEEYQGCNWGVACGPSRLVVLDIDGDEGERSLEDLEAIWGDLPETLVCRTASGGRHLYFKGEAKTTTSVGGKGSKIDSRSVGGMAFAPGSVIGDGQYHWELQVPIADCPEWLIEVIGEARSREAKDPKVLIEDAPADILKAQHWIETQPAAVEGEGGETATFGIMQVLRDFGLSVEKSAQLAYDSEWNQKCVPPWGLEELTVKAQNAASYSCGDQGSRSVVVDFCDEFGEEEEWEEEEKDHIRVDKLLLELNRVHSKQAAGGKVIVWSLDQDETGKRWNPYSTNEFDKIYEHRTKETAGGSMAVGPWWRKHPKHMRSKGMSLDPDKPPGPTGYDKPFNLWCGWGVRPRLSNGLGARDYQKLVVEALCGGVEEHAEYVFNWCSLLVQRPTVLPKVALVFRGEKGTGKSTLGLAMCEAFGPHAIKVDRLSAVTGQFNWHLKSKVFLLAEEIKWLKERGAEGVLKSLITDPHKGYEAKGVNMIEGLNYISVMINSNSDWVVPASLRDERRFAAFDVISHLRRQKDFWDRLYKGKSGYLQKEPLADFLGWLKARDISRFDPIRDVPYTQALQDQAIESLDFIERWWFDRLEEEKIPGTGAQWSETQDTFVPIDDLYQDYCNSIAHKYARSRHSLGRRLYQFGVERKRVRVAGMREYVYVIPPYDVARTRFFYRQENREMKKEEEDVI